MLEFNVEFIQNKALTTQLDCGIPEPKMMSISRYL